VARISSSIYTRVNAKARLSDGPLLDRAVLGGVGRPLDEESHALDLLDVVEGNEADVGAGERPLAVGDLLEDLAGISAAEHGELEHSPVPVVIVVLRGGEGEVR
jgi:hypothetical protein